MGLMEWAGYVSAVGVGVVLGLLGAGGSILSVPIFVYLFHVPAIVATVYSLFVVGFSSLAGAFAYYRQGLVDKKSALYFAPPALLGIFLARRVLLAQLPPVLFTVSDFSLTRDKLILLVFALVMIGSSYGMIRNAAPVSRGVRRPGLLVGQGLFVGLVTGFAGAGGGFLIVPALVLLVGLGMKAAIGTSLAILSVNSIFGFFVGVSSISTVDWSLLLKFLGLAILGNGIGRGLNRRIPAAKLKKGFGWFVLLMALWIFYKELGG